MDEKSLSYNTLRNASYNTVGYVVPILFSVFFTPIIVHKLGIVNYGIYILVNTVSAFLGMIDLGLSTAVLKYVAEYHGQGDRKGIERLLGSVGAVYFLIGVAGLLIFFVLGKWFLPIYKIFGASQQHIFIVFLLAGILFFINAVNSVYTIVPPALQRYDIVNKINLSQNILLNLGILGLVLLGYQLKAVMLANIVAMVLLTSVYRRIFYKLLPDIRLKFTWITAEIKRIYKFGLLTWVSSLAINSLAYIDRLIIPIFTGPTLLTYYSLPGNVAQKSAGIINSLSGMFIPLASNLSGKGETEIMKNLYVRSFRNLSLLSAAMTTAIVLFAYKILLFWLGKDFALQGANILVLAALTYYFVSLYIPLHGFLLGMGKLKFLIYSALGMAVLNIILLFLLVPPYGILGAAWAYLISVLPVIYVFYWAETRFLNLKNVCKFYFSLYGKLFVTAAICAVVVQFVILRWVNSLFNLLILGPLSVALYLLIYYAFGFFEAEDTALFKAFLVKFLRLKSLKSDG